MSERFINTSGSESRQNLLELNSHVLLGLTDFLTIVQAVGGLNYRLFGSLVTTAAVGGWYRRLGDVEALVDQNKRTAVNNALEELGYTTEPPAKNFNLGKIIVQGFSGAVQTFHKGQTEITLNFGQFQTDGSFVIPARFKLTSFYPAIVVKPHTYVLEGHTFVGVPPEAQYTLNSFGASADVQPTGKRAKDQALLRKYVDHSVVQAMYESKPGLYFNGRPLASERIIAAVSLFNKLKRTLST